MIKYILVAVLQIGNGGGLTVHDYASKTACEASQQLIIKQLRDGHDGYSVDCIPDDDSAVAIKQAEDANEKVEIKTDDLPLHISDDNLPTH